LLLLRKLNKNRVHLVNPLKLLLRTGLNRNKNSHNRTKQILKQSFTTVMLLMIRSNTYQVKPVMMPETLLEV
jgi:hypothetical protein